jgi:hypothetical protein
MKAVRTVNAGGDSRVPSEEPISVVIGAAKRYASLSKTLSPHSGRARALEYVILAVAHPSECPRIILVSLIYRNLDQNHTCEPDVDMFIPG